METSAVALAVEDLIVGRDAAAGEGQA